MRQDGPPGREAAGFRGLPRRRRGSERGIPLCGIPLANKKNAPSRSRLRPAHPIDLRRSDCRAGEPSTSGVPCSVQLETYCPLLRSSSTQKRRTIANCDNRVFAGDFSEESAGPGRNAPSPVLPRPASQPTAAEATACRRAIDLRRSVLGAPGTLWSRSTPVKRRGKRKVAFCILSVSAARTCALAHLLYSRWDHGFAEPGALSSTSPADLPLPRTASRESFVLVASRARRSGNLRCAAGPGKGIGGRKPRKLRRVENG